MDEINVTTTGLKNNVSGIMNNVYFKRKTVLVKRYGKILAKIVPVTVEKKKIDTTKCFGSIPDFPDVIKDRKNFKFKVNFDK
jgi:hypothetical protein